MVAAEAIDAAAPSPKDLTFVSSPLFSEMLLALRPLDVSEPLPAAVSLPIEGGTYSAEVALMRKEVDLRRQLSGIQSALARCNRKAAVGLRKREEEVKRRLAAVVGAAEDVRLAQGGGGEAGKAPVDTDADADACTALNTSADPPAGAGMSSVVDRGAELLARVLSRGRPPGTEEETWERVILAEHLRFRLEQLHGDAAEADHRSDAVGEVGEVDESPARAYVRYINKNFAQQQKSIPSVVKTG